MQILTTTNFKLIGIITSIYLIIKFRFIVYAFIFKCKKSIDVGEGFLNYAYIYKEIYLDNEYNINKSLDNSVVFDIGANLGLFTLNICEKFKNMKIHCFEPIPKIFNSLKNNTKKIGNNKVYLNNYGLSNENGIKSIIYYPYANGLSTTCDDMNKKLKYVNFFKRLVLYYGLRKKENIKIRLKKVKEYIKENKIKSIDVCKIDVECSELVILEGFEEYIEIVKVYYIEVENFRKNYLNKIKKLLKNYKIEIEGEDANWSNIIATRKY